MPRARIASATRRIPTIDDTGGAAQVAIVPHPRKIGYRDPAHVRQHTGYRVSGGSMSGVASGKPMMLPCLSLWPSIARTSSPFSLVTAPHTPETARTLAPARWNSAAPDVAEARNRDKIWASSPPRRTRRSALVWGCPEDDEARDRRLDTCITRANEKGGRIATGLRVLRRGPG